jgi:hypothetical protein
MIFIRHPRRHEMWRREPLRQVCYRDIYRDRTPKVSRAEFTEHRRDVA